MSKAERRLVKKTILPVEIIDDPKQLSGLVHFPTESFSNAIFPNVTSAVYKKNSIMYRNQLLRQNQPEQEDNRRREVELYDVTINPVKTKEKQYKIEVPIVRGSKLAKNNNRTNQIYFTFTFNNSEGKLQLLNGIHQAKMEIMIKGKSEAIFKERVDRQLMSMDNRRKQLPAEVRYERYQEQSQDNESK